MKARTLQRSDVLSRSEYEKVRADIRRQVAGLREQLGLATGPLCMAHFETRETLWFQVQETTYVEQLTAEQLDREIQAYGTLVPAWGDVVIRLECRATDRRQKEAIARLTGVEEELALSIGEHWLRGTPDRSPPGRISASRGIGCVHFVRFRLKRPQAAEFLALSSDVTLRIGHRAYWVTVPLPASLRNVLAAEWGSEQT